MESKRDKEENEDRRGKVTEEMVGNSALEAH